MHEFLLRYTMPVYPGASSGPSSAADLVDGSALFDAIAIAPHAGRHPWMRYAGFSTRLSSLNTSDTTTI
jgi:hypothetical protein